MVTCLDFLKKLPPRFQKASILPYDGLSAHMKGKPKEMIEGQEAWDRFQNAMKAIAKVPKSALPPSPFKKWVPKKKKLAVKK